jgi:hypothetical protein
MVVVNNGVKIRIASYRVSFEREKREMSEKEYVDTWGRRKGSSPSKAFCSSRERCMKPDMIIRRSSIPSSG